MNKRKRLSLIAMLTAGSLLFLSGCEGVDVTTINEEKVSIEAELAAEGLPAGDVSMHFVLHDADGSVLPSTNIIIYDEGSQIFTATTDENGTVRSSTLPYNTWLYYTVTDSSGELLAESDFIVKVSESYDALSIYPTQDVDPEEEGIAQCIIEIPLSKRDLRASVFLTEGGAISIASLTPYTGMEEVASEDEQAAY